MKEPTLTLTRKTARIIDVHPGEYGIVRASVQTADGTIFKRPAVKLCRLPLAVKGSEVPSKGGSILMQCTIIRPPAGN